jgi:hypothetical protein
LAATTEKANVAPYKGERNEAEVVLFQWANIDVMATRMLSECNAPGLADLAGEKILIRRSDVR